MSNRCSVSLQYGSYCLTGLPLLLRTVLPLAIQRSGRFALGGLGLGLLDQHVAAAVGIFEGNLEFGSHAGIECSDVRFAQDGGGARRVCGPGGDRAVSGNLLTEVVDMPCGRAAQQLAGHFLVVGIGKEACALGGIRVDELGRQIGEAVALIAFAEDRDHSWQAQHVKRQPATGCR